MTPTRRHTDDQLTRTRDRHQMLSRQLPPLHRLLTGSAVVNFDSGLSVSRAIDEWLSPTRIAAGENAGDDDTDDSPGRAGVTLAVLFEELRVRGLADLIAFRFSQY